ncbi:MAG: YEATS-associated helix-containing protein [Pseudohongiellaceae bacterium]
MNAHFTSLVIIMLLVGAAGGVVNYYTQPVRTLSNPALLKRFVVLGIGVTFLVPFVLDLFGSTLVVDSQGDPAKLLNYVAICLAIAFTPRFFLTNVTDNVVAEARAATEKVEALQYQLRQLQEELLPLIDMETEDDNLSEAAVAVAQDELDTTSTRVLKTLGCGRFIYRSLPGLCREVDADESTMVKALGFLTLRSLAGRVGGRKGVRWYITQRGRKLIDVAA